MNQDLKGMAFILTRPIRDSEQVGRAISERGGLVFYRPCIQIRLKKPDKDSLQQLMRDPGPGWLIFTSANAVRGFTRSLSDIAGLKDNLPKVAAVGGSTASALAERGIEPDLVPKKFTGKDMAEDLVRREAENESNHALVICGNLVRREPLEVLERAGWKVDTLEVYENVMPGNPEPMPEIDDAYVLFYSPSAFRNFLKMYEVPRRARLVSIGPATTAAITAAGYRVYKEALTHDTLGVLGVLP